MLKAYDYSEKRSDMTFPRDEKLYHAEKEIALKYVIENPTIAKTCRCPVCDSEDTRYIFSRWDINYNYCDKCKSIFIPVEDGILDNYLNLDEMKLFRCSEKYQNNSTLLRENNWNEQLMWAQFRIYRYLGRNTDLSVIDIGNKYLGYVNKLMKLDNVSNYELRDSILDVNTDKVEKADVILYLNQLQHEIHPIDSLKKIRDDLKKDGLLIINTRLGSGFDILSLKGGTEDIFPYEHVMLPSKQGLEHIIESAGYEILEITTPGSRDLDSVLKNKNRLDESDFFVKYLLDVADERMLMDFQQFLQKSGLSSFAQVIARRKDA